MGHRLWDSPHLFHRWHVCRWGVGLILYESIAIGRKILRSWDDLFIKLLIYGMDRLRIWEKIMAAVHLCEAWNLIVIQNAQISTDTSKLKAAMVGYLPRYARFMEEWSSQFTALRELDGVRWIVSIYPLGVKAEIQVGTWWSWLGFRWNQRKLVSDQVCKMNEVWDQTGTVDTIFKSKPSYACWSLNSFQGVYRFGIWNVFGISGKLKWLLWFWALRALMALVILVDCVLLDLAVRRNFFFPLIRWL